MESGTKKGDAQMFPLLINTHKTSNSLMSARCSKYVPIDYLRAEIKGVEIDEFLNNPILKLTEFVDVLSGEVHTNMAQFQEGRKPFTKATYLNLIFKYYHESKRLIMSGSLHTFYNEGRHNHNDFSLKAFRCVLNELKMLFNISPLQMHLTQIEWGVNLKVNFSVNTILNHCLCHKWVRFTEPITRINAKYIQVKHSDSYILKIYNKGLQFGLSQSILRFERKQLKYSRYCRSKNIGQTLQDLIESDFTGMQETLLSNWNEILFFDPFIDENEIQIIRYRDPIYWEKFLTRTTRKKHKDKLSKFNASHGQNVQGKINELIQLKFSELETDVFTFTPLSYIGNSLTLTRKCLVTGLNISMQKENSNLLSHNGLRYYFNTDTKVYDDVRQRYLSSRWENQSQEIQIREIAHSIRTKVHNQRTKQRRLYPPHQIQMFDY